MDYRKIYDNLIDSAKNNPKPDKYKENHHIIPVCMGGSNKKDNIVKLTAKQHYLAHWLLYKIYKTTALVYAWHSMSRISTGQEQRSINSRLFDHCRKEISKVLSENSKGLKNHFYGKTHSKEIKEKLSKINSGKNYRSELQIKEWIENVAKKPASKKQKQLLSDRNKKFIVVQNKFTLEKKYIEKTDQINYDLTTWLNPRKITPEKKEACVYCGLKTTKANIVRWHNDKCKGTNNEN